MTDEKFTKEELKELDTAFEKEDKKKLEELQKKHFSEEQKQKEVSKIDAQLREEKQKIEEIQKKRELVTTKAELKKLEKEEAYRKTRRYKLQQWAKRQSERAKPIAKAGVRGVRLTARGVSAVSRRRQPQQQPKRRKTPRELRKDKFYRDWKKKKTKRGFWF